MPRPWRVQYPGAIYHVMSRGWEAGELALRRKGDPAKLQIAVRLRRETTLPLKDIARCLHLGTARSASVRLHHVMQGAHGSKSAALAGP